MPYELTWEPEGVMRRYHGDVTVHERRRSLEAICGDRRFDDLRYAITDYLAVGHYEASEDATMEIAALHVAPLVTNPRLVIAAVAVRDDVVAHIRQLMALGWLRAPYRLFDRLDEARAWVSDPLR
ncbi:hypothetical protein ABXN37_16655 [Piscinibacter sakaiensis]|uniref:STAS/SEC14 domain-containing protein n=1 Tax=Piscinibacter sakaiensis TaxID=1547922 RepID=A0A0K8P2L3_PISS1|nr:hypothetical protein [Piscinibacter sakaiensis]GAP36774.1 hypothetical protein ISF6_2614 [Piscinibacter sakaiensis]